MASGEIAGSGPIPRTVLALYYNKENNNSQWSKIHQYAEMPMNHLGLKLRYHNIDQGLPDLKNTADLVGIISWFDSGTRLRDPVQYLKWLESAVRDGKKLVIMGDPGFQEDESGKPVSWLYVSRFYRLLGIQNMDEWVDYTYNLAFSYKNRSVVEFERGYHGFNPPYSKLLPARDDVVSHLVAHKAGLPETESHLVMTFPAGGYVADQYAMFAREINSSETRQWLINPFEFFRLAFETDRVPKPDCTTLAGRRVYYSHVDGDGWLNVTRIEAYRKQKWLSSKVVLEEVIRPFPDLPITITAVAAEIDPKWSGTEESREIARELFQLPQVEIGSHTYSHPFDWQFFADGNTDKEIPYLHKYPGGGWGGNRLKNRFLAAISKKEKKDYSYLETGIGHDSYVIPRAYARRPFDLDLEISGSAAYLDRLAPAGKQTTVLMWTGNTSPFEAALRKTRLSGLYNINGGDSRFDREFPSYAWVSPIGRQVGSETQIYSSNSNENTYTDLWRGRFHGFRYLIDTLENTEHPRRIKPINIYYHMYSGERRASINAVISNLNYVLSREIIPITTSDYCAVAEGFYSTEIDQAGPGRWRIKNRGRLQTIRFDDAENQSVDLVRSKGIIGQRHFQGNLYVYLDAAVDKPLLILTRSSQRKQNKAHLVQSRWQVWRLQQLRDRFTFHTKGFGSAEMTWYVPRRGTYTVTIADNKGRQEQIEVRVGKNHLLFINPVDLRNSSASVTVQETGKQ